MSYLQDTERDLKSILAPILAVSPIFHDIQISHKTWLQLVQDLQAGASGDFILPYVVLDMGAESPHTNGPYNALLNELPLSIFIIAPDQLATTTISSIAGNVVTVANATDFFVGQFVQSGTWQGYVFSIAGNDVTVDTNPTGAGSTLQSGNVHSVIRNVAEKVKKALWDASLNNDALSFRVIGQPRILVGASSASNQVFARGKYPLIGADVEMTLLVGEWPT